MKKLKPGPRPGKGGKKKVVSLALSPAALAKLQKLKSEGESASAVVERLILQG